MLGLSAVSGERGSTGAGRGEYWGMGVVCCCWREVGVGGLGLKWRCWLEVLGVVRATALPPY